MSIAELDKTRIFAKNLNALRKSHGWSVGDMATHAGIPKSTMQTALTSGRTTLDTAMRIADGLGLSLDSLVSDDLLVQKISTTQYLLQAVEWFQALSDSEQEEVAQHVQRILELIKK